MTNTTTGINADVAAVVNARGLKVNGHTMRWHNQSGPWPAANVLTADGFWSTPWDDATARTNLEVYVRTVSGHFDQQPYRTFSFDVVEAMKDNPADWRDALRTGYSPEERPSRWAQAYSKGGKSWDYWVGQNGTRVVAGLLDLLTAPRGAAVLRRLRADCTGAACRRSDTRRLDASLRRATVDRGRDQFGSVGGSQQTGGIPGVGRQPTGFGRRQVRPQVAKVQTEIGGPDTGVASLAGPP